MDQYAGWFWTFLILVIVVFLTQKYTAKFFENFFMRRDLLKDAQEAQLRQTALKEEIKDAKEHIPLVWQKAKMDLIERFKFGHASEGSVANILEDLQETYVFAWQAVWSVEAVDAVCIHLDIISPERKERLRNWYYALSPEKLGLRSI